MNTKKYIEKDAALERRFQPVLIEEPSLKILSPSCAAFANATKSSTESISPKAHSMPLSFFPHATSPTDRLPDKAIDLIDEAASLIRMQIGSLPLPIDIKERELSSLIVKQEALNARRHSPLAKPKRKKCRRRSPRSKKSLPFFDSNGNQEKKLIEQVKEKKMPWKHLRFQEEEAERRADYNKVAELRYRCHSQSCKKRSKRPKNNSTSKPNRLLQEEVDEPLIAQIVAKWTGIPVNRMLEGEAQRLLHLEKELGKRVVGQVFAIEAVSEAIRRSRAGLNDPSRPVGVFLFIGPTGVGKTELAKALAEQLFNQEEAIIRLDMSEYMEKHSVAKLIGSPPGYVGYEEGGQLTEALRRRPYAVVLFDEIEKAHHDVFNILLQIFDDGRITDSKGRTVNCKNALFIMTSNLGSDLLLEKIRSQPTGWTKEEVLAIVDPVLKMHFRPEFFNRLDEILPFLPLQEQDMEKIALIQLNRVAVRLLERGIKLQWEKSVLAYLAKKGYDPLYGARPLKRLIQQEVVNLLSTAILKGEIKNDSKMMLTLGEGEVIKVLSKI